MEEGAEGEELLMSHKKVTDWAPQQEVLGLDLDTERVFRDCSIYPPSGRI